MARTTRRIMLTFRATSFSESLSSLKAGNVVLAGIRRVYAAYLELTEVKHMTDGVNIVHLLLQQLGKFIIFAQQIDSGFQAQLGSLRPTG
jgi:hypothetical protein